MSESLFASIISTRSEDVPPMSDERRLAAINTALLVAYETFYGRLPQGLAEAVYTALIRSDYFCEPQILIKRAQAAALLWLGEQLETPGSSTGKSPAPEKTQSRGGSGKPGSGQRGIKKNPLKAL